MIALLMLLAGPAMATQDGWPALYDVTGVAANDVLNVRREPDAGSPIIGALKPEARNIEAIRPNDQLTWALVNAGEQSGWLSLRYLVRQPGQWDGQIPKIRRCFGTEPFWSLRIDASGAGVFSTPEGEIPTQTGAGLAAENRRDTFAFFGAFVTDPQISGLDRFSYVVRNRSCNDGMSDQNFGYEIDFLKHPNNGFSGTFGQQLLSGCCSLAP